MGEKQNRPFQLSFNTSLRSIFKDRGYLPTVVCCWCANWDEPLGLSALIIENTSWATSAGRTLSCRSRICCDSSSTVAWQDTKT